MLHHLVFKITTIIFILFLLNACLGGGGGDDGAPGANALVNMTLEPVGINCPNGGLRVDAGIDTNDNTTLDQSEITQTGYVCSGANGNIGWQVATLIEYDDSGDAESPSVTVNNSGIAVAVWSQFGGATTDIYASRYVPGTGWGVAELIETDNAMGASQPHVGIDTSGNALGVWTQFDGTRNNIWANRYVAGVGWGTAELIETNDAGSASSAKIVVDPSGNALAMWRQSDGATYSVWANHYLPGFGWGTSELIDSDNTGDSDNAQIAIDSNGNAIAVWQRSDGSRVNIWVNQYVVGTGWGTAELLETDDAGNAGWPQVAMDSNGNAMAVWHQSDGVRLKVRARRYVAGTGWDTEEVIETDMDLDAGAAQVAMAPNGNAVAIWFQLDGIHENYRANYYVVGSGWGNAENIETNFLGKTTDSFFQVAIDINGNALAVWPQSDGTQDNIWANRYVVGLGWGNAEIIETHAGLAKGPQIVIDGGGNAIVVWQQNDGTRENIWANHYLVQ